MTLSRHLIRGRQLEGRGLLTVVRLTQGAQTLADSCLPLACTPTMTLHFASLRKQGQIPVGPHGQNCSMRVERRCQILHCHFDHFSHMYAMSSPRRTQVRCTNLFRIQMPPNGLGDTKSDSLTAAFGARAHEHERQTSTHATWQISASRRPFPVVSRLSTWCVSPLSPPRPFFTDIYFNHASATITAIAKIRGAMEGPRP